MDSKVRTTKSIRGTFETNQGSDKLQQERFLEHRCRSMNFSRGGGGRFSKKFENFDDDFFLGQPH